MFTACWPAVKALHQLFYMHIHYHLHHGHSFSIAKTIQFTWKIVGSMLSWKMGQESLEFETLDTRHRACLLHPGQQLKPLANFCSIDIHFPLQWLRKAPDRMWVQGFDWTWDQMEVLCLKLWTPDIGHIYCAAASYPSLQPTQSLKPTCAAWALIGHCKGYTIQWWKFCRVTCDVQA